MKARHGLSLSELVRRFPELDIRGDADTLIDGVALDSRLCGPGDLFIAVRGERADGHRFLETAAAAGCAALMIDRDCAAAPPLPLLVAAATGRWPALLARELAGRPDTGLKVVGITGTNGKTTTAWLVRHLLRECLGPCGLLGTILYDDGRRERKAPLTTPDGVTLYSLFAGMRDHGCAAAALEISSHALDQGRAAGLELDVAVLTNLSRDHLDYHRDMADYLRAKLEILDLLRGEGRTKSPGRLALNADDPAFAQLHPAGLEILRYSVSDAGTPRGGTAADLQLTAAELTTGGSRLAFAYRGKTISFTTRLIGRFNLENTCAALAAGLALGLSPEACAGALSAAPQVPGRLERFDLPSGGCAVVDYAHTPDALAAVLDSCRELASGRVIAVFGCGGDRDTGKRPLMGAVAARRADLSWITSDNPRSEEPGAIIAMIEAGYHQQTGASAPRIEADRTRAVTGALREAVAGDVVVVAGKGHEDYQLVGDLRLDLDDRRIIRDWIANGAH